jgi:hypothetical protein
VLEDTSDDRPALRRTLILGGAAIVSLATLALALVLGAWAFEYRRLSLHEGRLKNLVERQPTVSVASQGLQNEGWTTIAVDLEDATLLRLFGPAPPPRVAEVRAKRARWPTARVYASEDLVYVLYFDPAGKAADFSLIKR